MRPIGRSAQELLVPVEYQVEVLFINFSVSSAEKGYREGPGSGILLESLVKATISQQQYLYQNHVKITYFLVKKQLFMCLPLASFETGFGFVSGFDED